MEWSNSTSATNLSLCEPGSNRVVHERIGDLFLGVNQRDCEATNSEFEDKDENYRHYVLRKLNEERKHLQTKLL